ncbi:MAG TPA: CCA tRNA nucleotidyltransferase [Xanthobacteraceae bacterium]|nr:CCA tRNA nucleotidyltransferase [Xanthobacteraceae bacterium]
MKEPPDPCRIADVGWLTSGPTARLLAVLDRDGEEARVVGGAVRNALLGEPPGDIDIATTALPEEIIRRVAARGFKAVPTGVEHGTVTVVVDGVPFEVTTLRQDVETFGRKASVRFGRDWKADAERRDFTMNALSVAADGTIHDHVGGVADLKARRVRFIGDPATRIAEDYLRILRFFRFHAAYGHGPPDRAGLTATVAARHGIDRLSRERVRTELLKLMIATGAAPTIAVMAETGLLGKVLGGVPLTAGFTNMVALEAVVGLPADPIRRLAALGVLVVEDAERLAPRLRLSNAEHERLVAMADGWWRITPVMGEAAARAALYRVGGAGFTDRALIAWARSGAEAADTAWRELALLGETWTPPRFPLKAADLIMRGVPAGPRLGTALKAAEAAWIAAGFPADRTALAAIADAAAGGAG